MRKECFHGDEECRWIGILVMLDYKLIWNLLTWQQSSFVFVSNATFVYLTTCEMRIPHYSGHFKIWLDGILIRKVPLYIHTYTLHIIYSGIINVATIHILYSWPHPQVFALEVSILLCLVDLTNDL